jgi:polar amino acid transport system substrate-binding protein
MRYNSFNYRNLALCIWIFLFFLTPDICFCESLVKVVSTSPSWSSFTNPDGTGLYHEIIDEIFTPLGIKVSHEYSNAARGIIMVEKGLADFYTCKSGSFSSPGLVRAPHPMYENQFHAVFKKSRVPNFTGSSSLANRNLVWRRGYYKQSEFKAAFVLFEADTGVSALDQVILGRADFYIDDQTLINESLSRTTLPFNRNDLKIEPVGKRTYHPVFKDSKRGNQILGIYEQGMEKLHQSGRLKAIFKKWNHPYPDYDAQSAVH